METPWRIELLGWLRAEQGERVVNRFATHKTAALLACLALWPRRAHAREELIDRLWPDADLDAARPRLRQALTSLRHQLEPPGTPRSSVLIADRTHIRLNPDAISTDVADFEAACRAGRLSEALAQYNGELLPGFYEDWIVDERERLAARADEVAQRLEKADVDEPTRQSPVPAPLTSASAPVVRLPMQFTRFFGREEEQEKIGGLLSHHRLVTLTGPGGAGKTRLAIEAARRQTGREVIAFVGLAGLTDGARIAEAAADALRLPREDRRPAMERLVDALSAQTTLLVLDNAEHVAAHAGPLVLTLLTRVPSLRLLVTSRRRLHLAGEREFAVPALPTPQDGGTLEQIASATAVQLFVDRAQAVRPDFQITAHNAADVGALCRRLEGSPLALELASARASALVPAQMLDKLAQRFELLATRRTDKDARHRSLWAAIAWSVDLLPESLRLFWGCLSVFRGGFTAEAAAAVTGDGAALESLTQLCERSLITPEDAPFEIRFRLLESLREFAEQQMGNEEQDDLRRRHGAFFLSLAETAEGGLRGSEQGQWLDRLEADHDNLRVALDDGISRGDAAFGQRLAAALWGFWERRGHLAEARQRLEQSLALPGPEITMVRARALDRLGAALNGQGEMEKVRAIHQEALRVYQALGDLAGVARTWNRLGFAAHYHGHSEDARAAFTEALTREHALGNGFNIGAALLGLGIVAQSQGQYAEARQWYAEGLAQFEALDIPASVADCLLNLAAVDVEQAQFDQALPLLERAGQLFENLGDRWSRAYAILGLAIVARRQQRLDDAARLGREALDVCREVGDGMQTASALLHLGAVALGVGDQAEAAVRYREALHLNIRLGQTSAVPGCLREMGALAAAQGQMARAARLLGSAENLREQLRRPLSPSDRPQYEHVVARVRKVLGDERFHLLWHDGRALTCEQAVAYALSDTEDLCLLTN